MARPLRVLCLHGFRTNKRVMSDQTLELQALLGPAAEFVSLNAPTEAEGEAEALVEFAYKDHRPFYEWWHQRLPNGEGIKDAAMAAKAIQEATKDGGSAFIPYDGLDESIALLNDAIEARGPFDVLLGFSQGSVMATILSMWHWKHRQQQPWKLNLCFNGYQSYGLNAQYLFQDKAGQRDLVPFPSVHVLGKKDPLYSEGLLQAQMYADGVDSRNNALKLVLEHEGGHRLPSSKKSPEVYEAILSAIERHCDFNAHSQTSAIA